MENLNFSIEGMAHMQLNEADRINGWLLDKTSDVKKSVLDNIRTNPDRGIKLIHNFCFLVKRNLLVTERIVFLERWNHSYITEIFLLAQKKIDPALIKVLNDSVRKICHAAEEELLDAYQDQKIDPFNNQQRPGVGAKKFSDFLTSNNNDLLIKKLKGVFGGKKGKNIAIMIIALEKLEMIAYNDRTELFTAIRKEFGNIGHDSGINDYLTPFKTQIQNSRKQLLTDSEIQPFVTMIKGFSD